MVHIQWKDRYNIGYRDIDAQHKELLDLLTGLPPGPLGPLRNRPVQGCLPPDLHGHLHAHPRLFEDALAKLGVPAEQCVYIDDIAA